jgi:hypothetical protein
MVGNMVWFLLNNESHATPPLPECESEKDREQYVRLLQRVRETIEWAMRTRRLVDPNARLG